MKRQALLIVALAMVLLSVVSHAQSEKQDPVPTLGPAQTPNFALDDTGSGWTREDPETLEGGQPGCACGFDAATGAPVCWDDLFCVDVAPCSPAGACPAGMVCVANNCCAPPLDFGCFPICPDGPACKNPGVCGSFQACGTGSSDCCVPHDTPGCDCQACQDIVCQFEPSCCELWHPVCADLAADFCFPLCNGGDFDCGGGGGEEKVYDIPLPAPGDIPDNDPIGFRHDFFVQDHGIILDLDVDLTITHTWVGDLCVVLEKKSDDGAGLTALLIDRPGANAGVPCHQGSPFGCSENNYVNIILDDEGAGGAIENQCPVGGNLISPPNYTPNNPLSAFDGIDKFGLWSITVTDNAAGDLGTLDSWSLHMVNAGGGPVCGDGLCEPPETCDSCPGDCGPCPFCGDGVVNLPGEECDGSDDEACPGACQADCTCGEPISDCCFAHDTPGCDCQACQDLVCDFDPSCCDDQWHPVCADIWAELFCQPLCDGGDFDCEAGVCGPGNGDCCIPNGTPGCDNEACCEAVCAIDPFCCDEAWDALCAFEAVVEPICACDVPCPPGDACNDFNSCTDADTCDDAGNCVGILTECDDGDPCTIDGCDPAVGCDSQPIECPEGQVCESGECVTDCGPCPTDGTGNGNTGAEDLPLLLACWGPLQPGCECFDFNHNGGIDAADLPVLLAAWGPCPTRKPKCDNPHNISGVIRECFHWANAVNGSPCRTTLCIENTLDTCTCDYHPDETGDPECDVDVATGPKIIQRVRRTPGDCPATVTWADWELSRTRHGCGTDCLQKTTGFAVWRIACVTPTCTGTVILTANRGEKKQCGCD